MAFYFYFYHIYYLYLSNCSTSPSTGSTACTTSYSSTPSSTWTSTVPPRHSPLQMNKDHQYAALGHLQGSTCSECLCLYNELKTSTIVFNCWYHQYKAQVHMSTSQQTSNISVWEDIRNSVYWQTSRIHSMPTDKRLHSAYFCVFKKIINLLFRHTFPNNNITVRQQR